MPDKVKQRKHLELSPKRLAVALVPEGSLANFSGRPSSVLGRASTPGAPRWPGLAWDINLHQNSAPKTNSNAKRRHPTIPVGLPSGTQVTSATREQQAADQPEYGKATAL